MSIRDWNPLRWLRRNRCAAPQLHLSVAGPEIAVMRLLQTVMVAMLLVSLGLAGWWWKGGVADHATAERIEAATSRLQAANDRFSRLLVQEGFTLTAAQVSEIKQQIAFANVLSAKRGLSWARLLIDLEEATTAEISYSSVQMNFKEATVALEGATSSLQGLNALVTGLNRHPAFSKATLSSHVLEAAKDSKSEGSMSDLSFGLPAVKHVLFHMTAAYSPTS